MALPEENVTVPHLCFALQYITRARLNYAYTFTQLCSALLYLRITLRRLTMPRLCVALYNLALPEPSITVLYPTCALLNYAHTHAQLYLTLLYLRIALHHTALPEPSPSKLGITTHYQRVTELWLTHYSIAPLRYFT